jgi:hypothetical protein
VIYHIVKLPQNIAIIMATMHAALWKIIFYACSILEEYSLCMQYFRRVYFMHAVLWKSIFYAYSILEEYILCMQYFRRVYFMHAVL